MLRITSFDDLCLTTYVLIDDLWPELAPACQRPGPPPACSDPELLTMVLVGESCGWDAETDLLAHFRAHRDLFPILPERSRFNRRRRGLATVINRFRLLLLGRLDLALDRQCAIDSVPVPVMQFHLVPSSTAVADWQAAGASFGTVPSKNQTIFGYKLHLLVTLNGVIRTFVLAAASAGDIEVAPDVLDGLRDLLVIADKGYVSAPLAAQLAAEQAITLLALRRKNQHEQLPAATRQAVTRLRQIIETVNSQLTEQWHIDRNRAHTFHGLCARLHSKLAAHTLGIYLNWQMGDAHPLHLKQLTLPN